MYVERLGMLFAVPCSWLNIVSFVWEHKSLGGDIVWTQTALLKYKLTLDKYISDHQSLPVWAQQLNHVDVRFLYLLYDLYVSSIRLLLELRFLNKCFIIKKKRKFSAWQHLHVLRLGVVFLQLKNSSVVMFFNSRL